MNPKIVVKAWPAPVLINNTITRRRRAALLWTLLYEKDRAGFVLSSQASSARNKEAEVRRKLVETKAVGRRRERGR